jgi:hypothetical protein
MISEAPRWGDRRQTTEVFSKLIMVGGEEGHR